MDSNLTLKINEGVWQGAWPGTLTQSIMRERTKSFFPITGYRTN